MMLGDLVTARLGGIDNGPGCRLAETVARAFSLACCMASSAAVDRGVLAACEGLYVGPPLCTVGYCIESARDGAEVVVYEGAEGSGEGIVARQDGSGPQPAMNLHLPQ